jgi:hypothetical protein
MSIAVFLYSSFIATWHMWRAVPIRSFPIRGVACIPVGDDDAQTLFLWLVFFPLVGGVPSAYCLFIAYRVWRDGLLKVTKRRTSWVLIPPVKQGSQRFECGAAGRDLAFHFARGSLLVFLLWLPATILFFGDALGNYWSFFVGGMLAHLQGLASAIFNIMQPDIFQAALDLICCGGSRSTVRVTPKLITPSKVIKPSAIT